MKKETEIHLRRVLKRLEVATEKVLETRGYNQDAAHLKLLQELIKEQIQNADTRPATGSLR